MPKKGEPRPPDDELTARLREAARRRRPGALVRWTLGLVIVGVPILAFFLFFEPSGPAGPVHALTFDVLVPEAEEAELVAHVFSSAHEATPPRLRGRTILFESTVAGPDAGVRRVAASTNADGMARTRCRPTKRMDEFIVRLPEGRITDHARVFCLSRTTALALVDVETTLTAAALEAWHKENVLDIPTSGDAGPALRSLGDKDWTIIYLAAASGDVYLHRKIRGWMENRFAEGYPVGPVLGRIGYAKESSLAAEYPQVLSRLRKTFTGPMHLIAGDSERAKQALALNINPLVLNAAEVPERVTAVQDWAAVAEYFERLKKE